MENRETSVADMHAAFKVLDLVPSKSGIRSSDCIRVDLSKAGVVSLRLSSDIMGVATARASGSWTPSQPLYIDRRIITPFILSVENSPKAAPFIWYWEDEKVCLKWGTRCLEMAPEKEVSGYGQFTKLESLKKLPIDEKMRASLAASASCATNDPSVPHLNCVYLKNGRVYATDQIILFTADTTGAKNIEVPIPASIVGTLSSTLVKEVYAGKDVIVVVCKNGRLEQAVQSRTKEFPFAAADKQLDWAKRFVKVLEFPSQDFGIVTNRLAAYLAGVKREDWVMRLEAKAGKSTVQVICKIATAKFEEVLKSTIVPEKDVVVEWPLDRLMPVFQHFSSLETTMLVKVEPPHFSTHLLECGNVKLLIAAKAKK